MKLKKYYPFLLGAGIILLFCGTRFYGLLSLPIFTDEAIYVRWAQIAESDANWRFISLTDGKQPLLIWAGAVFMQVVSNPLLAMRMVSVAAGLFTTVGIYLLATELFKDKKVALLSSFLYVIFPFALVYDKLAVYDSLVATFSIWALYLEVLLIRYRRLDVALMTAMVVGGGLLTKSSALFSLYLLPFSLLLFDVRSKKRILFFAQWLGLCFLVLVGALGVYSILRLSPYFPFIAEKNELFVYPFSEWVKHPFMTIDGNIVRMLGWLLGYTTFPILLLASLAVVIEKKFWREKYLLLTWFLLPFMALAFFGKPKFLFPRYIFFMTIPLLVLASFAVIKLMAKVKARHAQLLLLLVPVILVLRTDAYILTNFLKAPIPKSDKSQLIEGYASGVGVDETVAFLKEKSSSERIFVATEGTFGLMPQALQIHLSGNQNVEIAGFWPIEPTIPEQVLQAAQNMPTYFIFYAPCDLCSNEGVAPTNWPLKQIFQIPRAEKDSFYTLYQVIPE